MKIRFISILSLLAASVVMIASGVGAYRAAAGGEGAAYHWYVKRNSDGKQPVADSNMTFIEQFGGVYVDRNHGDDCSEKVIYLTFDAGYENGNIEKILNTLQEENVPAAFFILDNLIIKNTDLVCRMANEGHLVCNHTLKHHDMTKVHDKDAFASELEALEKLYLEKTGNTMAKFYRPPEGKFSRENMEFANALGYKTIFWSFAYADWDNDKQPDPEGAKKKILANTHNGAIVLLHPTSATNAEILRSLIEEWRARGYSFGKLSDL